MYYCKSNGCFFGCGDGGGEEASRSESCAVGLDGCSCVCGVSAIACGISIAGFLITGVFCKQEAGPMLLSACVVDGVHENVYGASMSSRQALYSARSLGEGVS